MEARKVLPHGFSPGGLTFLKLGGSLITEKDQPHTARFEIIRQLAQQIREFRSAYPGETLLIGHGSGSFGHVPARKHSTRQGVRSAEQWRGFVEVWREAWTLNRFVMEALLDAGLPAVAFSPSASLIARDGAPETWEMGPIQTALQAGLMPVVYGDVVFDLALGGTIFSTEDLFDYLAPKLRPGRILLAGIEAGIWRDFPQSTDLVAEIAPATFPDLLPVLGGSTATDVTGGMLRKVEQSLNWVQLMPGLEVVIFSGAEQGSLGKALRRERIGTLIHAAE